MLQCSSAGFSCPKEAPPAAHRVFYGDSIILLLIGTQVCTSPACPWELEPWSCSPPGLSAAGCTARAGKKPLLDSAASRCPRGHGSSRLNRPNSNSTNSTQQPGPKEFIGEAGGLIRAGFQRGRFHLKRTRSFPCQIKRLLLIPFFQGVKTIRAGTCPIHYRLRPQHSRRVVHM